MKNSSNMSIHFFYETNFLIIFIYTNNNFFHLYSPKVFYI